jgi:predicted dehydrogenase
MRFGLVGTGFWARVAHAKGVLAHPEADLVGVWGRSGVKTHNLAEELGVQAFPSFDAMVEEVEAVAVAVPPNAQAEFAVRAAERGRHLLLDKPLALDLEAADGVIRAVEDAGVRAGVFFTMRYTANIAAWLDGLPADGWFAGRIRNYTSIFEPGSPYAESPWRQERGAIWDITPHALSIALPILGPVDRVIAQRGLGDAVDLGLKHASGVTSLISVSLTAPAGARGSESVFFRTDGTVEMPAPEGDAVAAYTALVDDLIGAVRDGRDTRCDVYLGREVVRIIAEAEAAL